MDIGIDLEAYFTRIHYRGARDPSLESLRQLQSAHTLTIPFENIDVIQGFGVRLDLPSIEQKLVRQERGGYCFEQNALLAAVLENLGYRVTRLAARVRWQIPAEVAMPLTHMVLRVDVGGVPYLVDVGFGGMTPTAPLRLNTEEPQPTPHETFRLLPRGDAFVLQAQLVNDWSDVYRFTLEEQHPVDYELANWYTSRHPASRFMQNLIAARAGRDRTRVSLFNRELTVRRGSDPDKRNIETPEELLEVLANQFGLRFAPGTRFGAPGSAWPS